MSQPPDDQGDLWVFGYGSLMWNPGFSFEERHLGKINGYHRALCVYSHVYRGTPEQPGLVLGLDRGGACQGHVFRVSSSNAATTLAYLREREQVNSVYLERWFKVTFDDGRKVTALVYVADRNHSQYAGRLPLPELLRLVQHGRGQAGDNADYVRATHEHLVTLGIIDTTLAHLTDLINASSSPSDQK